MSVPPVERSNSAARGFARRERRLAERNVRAVGFDGANFHLRSVAGHHHPGADAAHLRRQRQRRAVISRRVRHHASRRLRFAERKNRVRRAANFERTGELQIFAFEIQQRARQLIERDRKSSPAFPRYEERCGGAPRESPGGRGPRKMECRVRSMRKLLRKAHYGTTCPGVVHASRKMRISLASISHAR